jgi:threonine/homoserine/homoserine lactone efflux protein
MEFITIALLHLFAVVSPGPDFVLITRQSIRYNRSIAIWASLGIATGILVHSLVAITGVVVIVTSNSFLFDAIKIVGAVYLLYLGIISIINSNKIKELTTTVSGKKENLNGFLAGLITNITNVKAILFFVTVFTVVIDQNTDRLTLSFYGIYMSISTFFWFAFISVVFTDKRFTSKFSFYLPVFEKIIGLILIMISSQIFLTQANIL